jgi:elongator complex protein 4
MSFRKKNVVLGGALPTRTPSTTAGGTVVQEKSLAPGIRPSPLDGRLTTSTGTASLDGLLAGHSGLPLGSCLLIEEAGTTEFGAGLLRYYTAEGLVQGHDVYVLGPGDQWKGTLPGLGKLGGSTGAKKSTESASDEKMKIAWRYETLGNRVTPGRGKKRDVVFSSSNVIFSNCALNDQMTPGQGWQARRPHFAIPLTSVSVWNQAR